LAERLGDIHDVAVCRTSLGELALLAGDEDDAEALLHAALAAQQQLHDSNCSGISLGHLGQLALERGDVAGAYESLNQSVALFTQIARHAWIAEIQVWSGMAHFAAGDEQQAEGSYLASLGIAQGRECGLGNSQRVAAGLDALAEVAVSRGDLERAAWLLGVAAQTLRAVSAAPMPLPPRLRAERDRAIARGRQALGEAGW